MSRHWSMYMHWSPAQDEVRAQEMGDRVARLPGREELRLVEVGEEELQGRQMVGEGAPRVS